MSRSRRRFLELVTLVSDQDARRTRIGASTKIGRPAGRGGLMMTCVHVRCGRRHRTDTPYAVPFRTFHAPGEKRAYMPSRCSSCSFTCVHQQIALSHESLDVDNTTRTCCPRTTRHLRRRSCLNQAKALQRSHRSATHIHHAFVQSPSAIEAMVLTDGWPGLLGFCTPMFFRKSTSDSVALDLLLPLSSR